MYKIRETAALRYRFFVLLILCVVVSQAWGAPKISFSPPQLTLAPGESAIVELIVSEIAPSAALAGFQVKLIFPPSAVNLFDPNDGFGLDPFKPLAGDPLCGIIRGTGAICLDPEWFLTSTGRTPVLLQVDIDNVDGVVMIAYGTRSQVNPPPVGAGVVALIEVHSIDGGSAEVMFDLNEDRTILATNQNPPTKIDFTATPLLINPAPDTDGDGDGVQDVDDLCPGTATGSIVDSFGCSTAQVDSDGDGVCNADAPAGAGGPPPGCNGSDVCPATPQGELVNAEGCSDTQTDSDNDGVTDALDNCPMNANPNQEDNDNDNIGDVCDPDDDNDGVDDGDDAFPFEPTESTDNDGDGTGDNADTDDDNDRQTDADEIACGSDPLDAGSTSPDADNNNVPDCVDTDDDGDQVSDNNDVCPSTVIPEAVPTSSRGLGRNRWTLENPTGSFTQGPPQAGRMFSFTTADTRGCSCEQIIDGLGLGKGHSKYGCSNSAMIDWANMQQ